MTTAMIPSTSVPRPALSVESPAPLHVLIVDDERAVREGCGDAATSLGHHITVTDTVERAFWIVGSEAIDCVLLGFKLPDRARLQSLREIKKRRDGVEVVITSADSTAQAGVESMKAGAFDHLTKPFGVEELRTVLDRVSSELSSRSKGFITSQLF
jgi:DNA-binding NtrC family response regulator